MGKKGAKIPAKAAEPTSPPPKPAAAASRLNEFGRTPEEQAAEDERMREREPKAKASQQRDLKKNEKKQYWENENRKINRKKIQGEKKWEKAVAAVLQEGKKNGSILEADEWDDGNWYVSPSGPTDKTKIWIEVQGNFYCQVCEAHLNECTLEAHTASKKHQNRVGYPWPSAGQAAAGPAASASSAASAPASAAAAAPRPPVVQNPYGRGQLPAWQEYADCGVRCLACNKITDEIHEATLDHKKRLQGWFERSELEKKGYPAPELPYLAWVPSDENDPKSEKWQMCLLCSKGGKIGTWVQDESSHSGTPSQPAGSNEHQKNLRNWSMWKEDIFKKKSKYHPEICQPQTRQQIPTGPTTPAPWAAQVSAAAAAPAPPPPPPLPSAWTQPIQAKGPPDPPPGPPPPAAQGVAAKPAIDDEEEHEV